MKPFLMMKLSPDMFLSIHKTIIEGRKSPFYDTKIKGNTLLGIEILELKCILVSQTLGQKGFD